MGSQLDISLVVKVAKMYYLEGLKQEDIAKQIGISRSLISMILTEAKENGHRRDYCARSLPQR